MDAETDAGVETLANGGFDVSAMVFFSRERERMPFGFYLIDKTRSEHLAELATLASDPATLVFLDTNILSYFYKLHSGARRQMFTWTDALCAVGRLCIPAWAASEYVTRVTKGQLREFTPENKSPDTPKRTLDGMVDAASLFLDDTVLRSIEFEGDRDAFLAQFKTAINALPQFTRAFKHQFDPEAVHAEIEKHLKPAVWLSDLGELCARADREGKARIENRIPPAYQDDGKKENRFGDLIIWYEILEHSRAKAAQFPKVLFITNDGKRDWVYAPQRRMEDVRGRRTAVPNGPPDPLKVIDPRLVGEFQRVVGHPNVIICSLHALIEGLSKEGRFDFSQLAAAIQKNPDLAGAQGAQVSSDDTEASTVASARGNNQDTEPAVQEVSRVAEAQKPEGDAQQPENLAEEVQAEAVPEVSGPEPVVEPAPGEVAPQQEELGAGVPASAVPGVAYALDALRDSAYEFDAPSSINGIIRSLKSHNWYTQNPAIDNIRSIRQEQHSADAWFVLGRNVYQAACGSSGKAMEFLDNLEIQLSRMPPDTANHFLAGMLFEIYFDSRGEFRHSLKVQLIDKPLQQAASECYAGAKEFIRGQLEPHRNRLLYMPGDTHQVDLIVTFEPVAAQGDVTVSTTTAVLRSVSLGGVELLRAREVSENSVWGRGYISEFDLDSLLQLISRTVAIPRWGLKRTFRPALRTPHITFSVPDEYDLDVRQALPNIPEEE